jgi:uncharacterized protein (DUF885 family)
MIDRRTLLAAGVVSLTPRIAAAADADLSALLSDVLGGLKPRDPAGARAAAIRLARFSRAGLTPIRQLELDAILAGLRREAATAQGSYARELELALGRPIDPAAAHGLAITQAQVLQGRADVLLRGQGLRQGPVADRLRAFARDPRHLYSDDDPGRDRAVADMNRALSRLTPRLRAAFGDLPIPDAGVSRMAREDEARARGGYRQDATPGKPGLYYVDLHDIRSRPSWTLASVAYHELLPGHILQGLHQAAARPHPLRLRYAGAFSEGWATYSEQLAGDLGVYREDPAAEIGALQWRLFRLGRIVADTGQGALGWSRDQAEAAMRDLHGRSIAFITIEADVARMVETPGAAAAQGLAALEIARLRGVNAANPAFHRAVLVDGPWPLEALARRARLRL